MDQFSGRLVHTSEPSSLTVEEFRSMFGGGIKLATSHGPADDVTLTSTSKSPFAGPAQVRADVDMVPSAKSGTGRYVTDAEGEL